MSDTQISRCTCCGQQMHPTDYIERLRADNATLRQALKTHAEEAAKMVNAEPVGYFDVYASKHGTHYVHIKDEYADETSVKLYTSPRIPEGWVMVPKEPTQEMVKAGNMGQGFSFQALKAAIAAAPEPD